MTKNSLIVKIKDVYFTTKNKKFKLSLPRYVYISIYLIIRVKKLHLLPKSQILIVHLDEIIANFQTLLITY